MRLTQDDDHIILRDQSAVRWALGAFFAAIGGLFVYGGLGGFSNHAEAGPLANAAAVGMGVVAVAAGAFAAFGTVGTTIVLHRSRRAFTVRESRWGRTTAREIAAGDIADVRVTRETDGDDQVLHGIVMVQRDGSEVRLTADATSRDELERMVTVLVREAGLRTIAAGVR